MVTSLFRPAYGYVSQFSDGQPLNQRNLRRESAWLAGMSLTVKPRAGAIETSGGFPGAKREASCFAMARTLAQT